MILAKYFYFLFSSFLFLRGLRVLFWYFSVKMFLCQSKNKLAGTEIKEIIIFIPLLHEETRLPVLIARFSKIINKFPIVKVVLITTERERTGGCRQAVDTITLVKRIKKDGFFHIHYPFLNKTLAPQINFAVKQIESSVDFKAVQTFFGFYNADSNASPETIHSLLSEIPKNSEVSIFQQSSCFTENYKELSSRLKLVALANAIRQTAWTFFHEIPRYLKNKKSNFSLAHCVTHGLFIRADTFLKLRGFPEDGFGEDLYFGFIARSFGYQIFPIVPLENSASPERIGSLLRQQYTWFWGDLGYFYYWYRVIKRFKKADGINYSILFFQTTLGIIDAFGWLLSGPFFIVFLLTAWYLDVFFLTIFAVYLYFGLVVICSLKIYEGLKPRSLFPKIKKIDKFFVFLFYPVTVLLRSAPAFLTILKDIQLRISKGEYFRPKTE